MQQPLLIVGASARAAAEAAARSGFQPMAIDQFGDEDLRRIAMVRTCERFPDAIAQIAADFPPAPVVLTGGMENNPHVVDLLATSRTLYGCSSQVLCRVRDPLQLQQALARSGLPTVETHSHIPPHAESVPWLEKPLRGSGGIGIRILKDGASAKSRKGYYYQRWLGGLSQSGLFLAFSGTATLLGVTEQWVGTSWLHARPFGYAGSLGPVVLESETRVAWEAIGSTLAEQFGLRGLFGVDAMVADQIVQAVEVNPRFTASAEIIDRANQSHIMRQHVRACRGESVENRPAAEPGEQFAKAIYFAPRDLVFPHELSDFSLSDPKDTVDVRLADIPSPATPIAKTHPVATLVARGSKDHIRQTLRQATELFATQLLAKNQEPSASCFSVIGDQRRPANSG